MEYDHLLERPAPLPRLTVQLRYYRLERAELATLRSPFYSDGINFYVLGKRIMGRKFEPISEDYSPPLAAIVDRMLQIDPNNRPTAAEVFEACVAASSGA